VLAVMLLLPLLLGSHGLVPLTVASLAAPTTGTAASRTVLVTGGAGYIGSHTCVELLSLPEYNKVVVVDNLDNSSQESLKRVVELTNCDPQRLVFRNCDLRDKQSLQQGTIDRSREGGE
jgi:FlaA1/EpsC-like NDP-sugar epimerase